MVSMQYVKEFKRLQEQLSADLVSNTAYVDSIVLYTRPNCAACLRARAYLAEKGLAYKLVNLDIDRQANQDLEATGPRAIVPTIKIGKEFVIGFSPDLIDRALQLISDDGTR